MTNLVIVWKEGEAKGYTDIIPMEWLVDDSERPSIMHEMLGPRGGRWSARCAVLVLGSTVTLDYGGDHEKENKEVLGVQSGVLKLVFATTERDGLPSMYWKGEKSKTFTSAPVVVSTASYNIREGRINLENEVLGVEGAARLVTHMRRERRPELRAKKLESMRARNEVIRCEACKLDFEAVYGPLGAGACEVHHIVPLAETGHREVSLRDLAVLCANCHGAIHQTFPIVDVPTFANNYVLKRS